MAARRVDLSVDMLDPGDDTPAALEQRSAESGVRGAERRPPDSALLRSSAAGISSPGSSIKIIDE